MRQFEIKDKKGDFALKVDDDVGAELDGVLLILGTFATKEAAALAYDVAVRKHFGAFGRYNFPLKDERSALDW